MTKLDINIPSKDEAEILLQESERLNPGPWADHSRYVAKAGEAFAGKCSGLDPDTAYVLGCLHDIGRRFGVSGMRHVVDGYRYLISIGYDDAARVSLTHSYPIKVAASGFGRWDGTADELQFVQDFLDRTEYTLFDRLIQLCDSIALPTGFVLMEKRLVDVAMRYGFNDYVIPKWKAYLEIKGEFERLMGGSIYRLLPGVVENSFGFEDQI